jgi:hypothetical protein
VEPHRSVQMPLQYNPYLTYAPNSNMDLYIGMKQPYPSSQTSIQLNRWPFNSARRHFQPINVQYGKTRQQLKNASSSRILSEVPKGCPIYQGVVHTSGTCGLYCYSLLHRLMMILLCRFTGVQILKVRKNHGLCRRLSRASRCIASNHRSTVHLHVYPWFLHFWRRSFYAKLRQSRIQTRVG